MRAGQDSQREGCGTAEMSHNGGQDLLRVLGEAIRAGDLLGTGPGGGLNASAAAQRGQSQDGPR